MNSQLLTLSKHTVSVIKTS